MRKSTALRLHEAEQEIIMLKWQAEHPSPIDVELTDDFGRKHLTRTRSEPWMLCGTAVILVDGRSGGYRLDRLTPVAQAP
jgi:hypothetical protein